MGFFNITIYLYPESSMAVWDFINRPGRQMSQINFFSDEHKLVRNSN